MTDPGTVLCPDCGWTGERSELVGEGPERDCPVCAGTVEIID